ncbi:MAG: ABC transporter permease subunit [Candidatus Eremiobacteraeota bacterium]|nr:ABC transporter permease subunit [Candidatus Eremiobacteraeota bacterium]MCW5869467.1 ABC transporter permease subunit [Candidatus Eremiobacteraeota bacterium]
METLWLLYRRELRSTLRERNVVLYVVVVPLLLYPFLIWLAMSAVSVLTAEQDRTPLRIVVSGQEPQLERALEHEKFILTESRDPKADVAAGKIDAWIDATSQTSLELVYDGRYRQGQQARYRLYPLLQTFRDVRLEQLALDGGARLSDLQPVFLEQKNEGTSNDMGRFLLGTFLPLCLLVVLALGGLYPAVETLAGEHERQTVDTTMGLSVSRWQLVVAKYALVVSLCCISGICNLLAITLSLRAILTPFANNLALSFGFSLASLLTLALGILIMSMLVAAATLLCTAHARTFRQGQAATTPLFMAILIPASALIDRSLSLDVHTCWIPVVNVALLWRDSLTHGVPLGLTLATLGCSLGWVGLILGVLTWRLARQGRALGFWEGSPTPK